MGRRPQRAEIQSARSPGPRFTGLKSHFHIFLWKTIKFHNNIFIFKNIVPETYNRVFTATLWGKCNGLVFPMSIRPFFMSSPVTPSVRHTHVWHTYRFRHFVLLLWPLLLLKSHRMNHSSQTFLFVFRTLFTVIAKTHDGLWEIIVFCRSLHYSVPNSIYCQTLSQIRYQFNTEVS